MVVHRVNEAGEIDQKWRIRHLFHLNIRSFGHILKIAYFSLIFGDRFPLIKPKIKTYGANGQYET